MEIYLPVILDGAMGTRLQAAGYNGQCQQEEWMLDNVDTVKEIQRSYIAAGSRIIYAPTFQSNPIKLAEAGLEGSVQEFNSKLADLSRAAVNESQHEATLAESSDDIPASAAASVYVAGDISPTGHFLAPLGDVSFEELFRCYEEQVTALDGSVDLWVVETMMTLSDARAAVLAIREHSPKPILVTFSCDAKGRTVSGGDVCAILAVLQGMGIDAFGLNCSSGPEDMLPQLERLSELAEVPLIAKPNAGLPVFKDGSAVYEMSPAEFVRDVKRMAELGVGFFGGCCGTTEEHIKALSAAVAGLAVAPPIPWKERFPGKLPLADERNVYAESQCFDSDAGSILVNADSDTDSILVNVDSNTDSILVNVDSNADIDKIAEEQYLWNAPLCLSGNDIAMLEQALRVYQGRAMYVGELGADELKSLVSKYGLIVKSQAFFH